MSTRTIADYQRTIDAIARMEADGHELAPTMEARAEELARACRTAAALLRDRRRAGFPDPEPAPWPASTWEFLAKHARRFQ